LIISFSSENLSTKEEQEENIVRTRRALINIINIYLTDFNKSKRRYPKIQ
jgi:uncharacterized protein YpmS